ncbi:MAG: c-type cytochrome [Puniceicoccales bacterium]
MSDQEKPSSHNHEPAPGAGHEQHEAAAYGDEEMVHVHKQLERENGEPEEGFTPVPMALMVCFGVLFFWTGMYFTKYNGDFRPDVFSADWRPGSGGQQGEVAFDPIKRGDRLFSNNCATCHQADGNGVPGAFPPLDGSPWVVGAPERFVKIVMRGLQGPVEVKGNTYNGNMPSYGENGLDWDDRDISAITTFVRQSWSNEAPAVSEELVAEVRASIADKSGAWSADELLDMHPME